ncbi:glycosyltransferase family 2 protein [Vogesella facilis]|uniref:Glycosyltransferase family 2 protein n=1 Tax=Vogesella facilis TaxID=1655232 RepID=A0ABV7RCW8_9NEIS
MNNQISVIIPCYNSHSVIERCLDSVKNQTHAVFEVIVIDDGSKDPSQLINIISKFKSSLNITFLQNEENKGAAYARNRGVEIAKGKYLAFLDSDDVWHPQKIITQVCYMEKHNLHMTGHGYVFDLSYSRMSATTDKSVKKIERFNFCIRNPFYTPTIMVRRFGFVHFDERHRRMEDYRCWLENVSAGESWLLPHNLAGGFKPPIGASGLTGSLSKMHASYLAVLKNLFQEKKVNFTFYFIASALEYIKYPIRKIRVYMKNIKND